MTDMQPSLFDATQQRSTERPTRTFGPAYDAARDGERLQRQMDKIRDFMLGRQDWMTLGEIATATGHPEASVSAQLRHLRKTRFGSYTVEKRRRGLGGTWEYRVRA